MTQGKKYDAILFDVDSKDPSVGMSCPPKQFVEIEFLKTVKDCLLDDGFFILNLVARNVKLRNQVVNDLRIIYKFVTSYKVAEDVNEIIFCSNKENDFKDWKNLIQESAEVLNTQAKSKNPTSDELIKVTSLLKNLKIEK